MGHRRQVQPDQQPQHARPVGSAALRQGARQQHDPRRLEPVGRSHPHRGVGADLPSGAAAAHGAAGGDDAEPSGAGAGGVHPHHARRSFAQAMPPTQINVFTHAARSVDRRTRRSACAWPGASLGLDMSVVVLSRPLGHPDAGVGDAEGRTASSTSSSCGRAWTCSAPTSPARSRSSKGLGYWIEARPVLPAEDHLRHLQRRVRRARPDHASSRPATRTPTATTVSSRTSWRPSSSAARSSRRRRSSS